MVKTTELTVPEFRVLLHGLVLEDGGQSVERLLLDIAVRRVLPQPLAQLLPVVAARQHGLDEFDEHSGKISSHKLLNS